jgi:hypothetical protein
MSSTLDDWPRTGSVFFRGTSPTPAQPDAELEVQVCQLRKSLVSSCGHDLTHDRLTIRRWNSWIESFKLKGDIRQDIHDTLYHLDSSQRVTASAWTQAGYDRGWSSCSSSLAQTKPPSVGQDPGVQSFTELAESRNLEISLIQSQQAHQTNHAQRVSSSSDCSMDSPYPMADTNDLVGRTRESPDVASRHPPQSRPLGRRLSRLATTCDRSDDKACSRTTPVTWERGQGFESMCRAG